MIDQISDSEKVKSTFESYAKKFDAIYEPSERKTPFESGASIRFVLKLCLGWIWSPSCKKFSDLSLSDF